MAALGIWEYAGAAIGAVVLYAILRRMLAKSARAGPACLKCGVRHGVSACPYCQGRYCQTHVFREAHHCQETKRTASS